MQKNFLKNFKKSSIDLKKYSKEITLFSKKIKYTKEEKENYKEYKKNNISFLNKKINNMLIFSKRQKLYLSLIIVFIFLVNFIALIVLKANTSMQKEDIKTFSGFFTIFTLSSGIIFLLFYIYKKIKDFYIFKLIRRKNYLLSELEPEMQEIKETEIIFPETLEKVEETKSALYDFKQMILKSLKFLIISLIFIIYFSLNVIFLSEPYSSILKTFFIVVCGVLGLITVYYEMLTFKESLKNEYSITKSEKILLASGVILQVPFIIASILIFKKREKIEKAQEIIEIKEEKTQEE